MIVSDLLDAIKNDSGYIINSLILKSSNDTGVIYKWLWRYTSTTAIRREIFIAANAIASDVIADRTVIDYVEVKPPE